MNTKLACSFPVRAVLAAAATLGFSVAGCAESTQQPLPGTGGAVVIATSASSSSGSSNDAGAGGGVPCLHESDCMGIGDTCNVGACLNNICVKNPAHDGTPCDDGLYCTVNDVCTMGTCGGTQMVCNGTDGGTNPCETGVCNEEMKTCIPMPAPSGGPCVPSDPCFTAGECAGGACIGTTSMDCSFLTTACATGACSQGACKATPAPDNTVCDDQSFDPCSPGACMAGTCQAAQLADGTTCTLGFSDPCNNYQCLSGVCTGIPANDGMTCETADGCDLFQCMSGQCSTVSAPDGTSCTNFDLCTVNETCTGGNCGGGVPNPCGPTNGCFDNSCDSSFGCTSTQKKNGTACDNGGDTCNTGATCTKGVCGGGTPTADGTSCTSLTSCITNATCTKGACGGGTGPSIYFEEEFNDNSKGWVLDAEWQIGVATASNFCEFIGNDDPSYDSPISPSGGVAGVVIGGCAATTVHAMRYLTSPAFDTSAATGTIIFGYYRFLNSDVAPNMTNEIDVYDGATWHTVWTDGTGITDAGWVYQSFDVTAYKSASMKVRFGFAIGSTNVEPVAGWNVDDVIVGSATCM